MQLSDESWCRGGPSRREKIEGACSGEGGQKIVSLDSHPHGWRIIKADCCDLPAGVSTFEQGSGERGESRCSEQQEDASSAVVLAAFRTTAATTASARHPPASPPPAPRRLPQQRFPTAPRALHDEPAPPFSI